MGVTKTLGGDRLGSGKRMKVHLHGYERSTHDMGYLWRSTLSAGTLVPFLCEVALPGDTFDINLDCDIKTHPTVGPLFGSYKVQLDVFTAPIRLYNAHLHNNKLGIGLNMSQIKLPIIKLHTNGANQNKNEDPDNLQINPSCLLSYLGIRGLGTTDQTTAIERQFNGVPLLAYWDIFKNYYANKQEEDAWMIHTSIAAIVNTIDSISIDAELVTFGSATGLVAVTANEPISIPYTGASPITNQVIFYTSAGNLTLETVIENPTFGGGFLTGTWNYALTGNINVYGWNYLNPSDLPVSPPNLVSFSLSTIDNMREQILAAALASTPFDINATGLAPYVNLLTNVGTVVPYVFSQEGLAVKTYQSDLFNNWLSEEWIEGTNGINEITAIDTTGGSFTIDTLNLSKKVYDMLNRIAVSGGTYDDWLDAVYTHDRFTRVETPIYHGGLIRELVFQEVISNSQGPQTEENTKGQPLGTLGGRGIMAAKKKGGNITVKVDEPSYLMGIISLTPRIDYSQGNKWDVNLKTLDDLHKPALDEIGFQDLIIEQMAWWTTEYNNATATWEQKSAGKQPAWINYMTNVNQTRGNFAVQDNEMWMTLNRRYERQGGEITDLTTYIDPVKYNNSFASTAIDSQNFWAQIAVDMTARRKMSAKLMPNL